MFNLNRFCTSFALVLGLSASGTSLYCQSSANLSVGPTGGYIRNSHSPRVIVFVHGLFSGPDAWRCDSDHYWPSMIAKDGNPVFADTDIYVVGYPTPKTHGKMTIADLESTIMNQMEADEVFQQHKEVIFVAHSLGGIITQQLLLTYQDKQLAKKVKFIFFFGTPLEGSKLANLGKYFSSDPLLRELQAGEGNFVLHDMDEKWMHAGFGSVHRYCAYETKSEGISKVVNTNSATRGCEDTLAIDANHTGLVKPCDTRAAAYIALANKLRAIDLTPEDNAGNIKGISVEPSESMDKQEAFQQQFTVANNNSQPIYHVHYACTIYAISLADGKSDPMLAQDLMITAPYMRMMMMIPYMKPISVLNAGGKTTTDCDYLMRYGLGLQTASIEIDVSFRMEEKGPDLFKTQGFSGRRGADNSFIWTYGSPYESPLNASSSDKLRLVQLMMFAGGNRGLAPHPTPEEAYEETKDWLGPLNRAGCKVVVATMISGRYN